MDFHGREDISQGTNRLTKNNLWRKEGVKKKDENAQTKTFLILPLGKSRGGGGPLGKPSISTRANKKKVRKR